MTGASLTLVLGRSSLTKQEQAEAMKVACARWKKTLLPSGSPCLSDVPREDLSCHICMSKVGSLCEEARSFVPCANHTVRVVELILPGRSVLVLDVDMVDALDLCGCIVMLLRAVAHLLVLRQGSSSSLQPRRDLFTSRWFPEFAQGLSPTLAVRRSELVSEPCCYTFLLYVSETFRKPPGLKLYFITVDPR